MGRPHLDLTNDCNANEAIMATDQLNIFKYTRHSGNNFEYVDNPISHESNAKLILCDANVKGHTVAEVMRAIMERAGYNIINIGMDNTGSPVGFIEPTIAQQYKAVDNYYQRKFIADDLFREFQWSKFQGNNQNEGELCYDYFRLVHNRDLHKLKSFFISEIHRLLIEQAMKGQYQVQTDDDVTLGDHEQILGFDETGQFGVILETMPTPWIALDLGSQIVPFDKHLHTDGGLIGGVFVLNRRPTPPTELLVLARNNLHHPRHQISLRK
jgi:hypothetical protein